MMTERKGDWIQTYTGRQFWPLDPRTDEIFIEDIAHSLSLQCRYAGHCLRFYSVAEHSVHIARHVAPELALWGLLHDAAEAYLVDVPRPVKHELAEYAAIEKRLARVIGQTFRVEPFSLASLKVKEADYRICVDEKAQNMAPGPMWGIDNIDPLGVTLEFWSPERAEEEFLRAFKTLTEDLAAWRAGRDG